MPRVKLFDREEVLGKAMELFWTKGFASTSLSDLVAHLGISKGSFYDTFSSKRELFDEALDLYRQLNLSVLLNVLKGEEEPKKSIRQLFEVMLETVISDDKRKGCLIANTCSEMGGSDETINQMLEDHHQIMSDAITNKLTYNNFKSDSEARNLANVYITFMTGLNQEIKFNRNKAELKKSIDTMLSLL